VVQPLVDYLKPGTYQGTLTLQFSDGRVSAIGITFVVTPAGTVSTANSRTTRIRPADTTVTCTATQLVPKLTTLGPGFNVPAGFAQGLEAKVVDDCGSALQTGTVYVYFSNGDAPVKLNSLNTGRWDGTWVAGAQQVSQVTLTVEAHDVQGQLKGSNTVTGGLGALQAPPQVSPGGIVSAANYATTPVAPGGVISIFGTRLSDGTAAAQVLPLPTMLDGTMVTITGKTGGNGSETLTMPLYYTSDGLLNALMPYGVDLNANQQLLVQRDATYAAPVYVNVAAAQPAVFMANGGPLITDTDGKLINAQNPAHAGQVIVIYCSGLGAVNTPVDDGAAASTADATVNPVTVNIGGKDAAVYYAGLSPSSAGLYQVNVTVPSGTPTGDTVPLTISLAGQASTGVQIGVR
jgi:uncharacterized protein (TIGR03437 family)